jgi:hypothetical protein
MKASIQVYAKLLTILLWYRGLITVYIHIAICRVDNNSSVILKAGNCFYSYNRGLITAFIQEYRNSITASIQWYEVLISALVHIYRMSQKERSIFWEVTVSVILSKKVYMYMCPNPNVFRDTAISLYSSKIVDKKEILLTLSNTGIYCSSDKVGTVHLV